MNKNLTSLEDHILNNEGTEHPFSSPLNDEYREGIYSCKSCYTPLFKSDYKFDSGSGWPSFFDVIDNAIEKKEDYKLGVKRIEYHCKKCGGHHGHVFPDGPKPTGLRYCNNGASLIFTPNHK